MVVAHTPFNVSNDILEIAVFMATSPYMHFLTAAKIVSSFAGIILMLSSICQKWQLAHCSLYLLVAQHCIWTLLMAILFLVDNSIIAFVHMTWRDESDLFLYNDGLSCFHRVSWFVLTFHGSITSIVVVTFERAAAYVLRKGYEKSCHRLGYVLTVVNLFFTGLFQYGVYLHFDFDGYHAYCSVLSPSGLKYHQTIAVSVVILSLELLTMVSYQYLLRLNNQKLSKGCETLTERYQVTENIRSLEYLVAVVCSTISLNVCAVVIFIVISHLPIDFGKKTHAIAENSVSFIHLHAIVLPIVLYVNNRKEERSRKQVLQVNRARGETFVLSHINAIQKAW